MDRTYQEYLERKRELKEAVLKQIGNKEDRAWKYIESITVLTKEEWIEVQKATYGPNYEKLLKDSV